MLVVTSTTECENILTPVTLSGAKGLDGLGVMDGVLARSASPGINGPTPPDTSSSARGGLLSMTVSQQ